MTSNRPIKKIFLIQPAAFTNLERSDLTPQMGLGLAYIGAVLEKEGYEVRALDAMLEGWDQTEFTPPDRLLVGLNPTQIAERIADFRPDVVGITSMFTSQRKNMHAVAAAAKSVDPGIRVIVGGAHPTAAPESVLEDANVDAIVLGEGDNSVVPLIKALEMGSDLGALDGIGYRGPDGRPLLIPKTQQVLDLDALPFPARHLLPMEKYFKIRTRHGGYFSGRAASMITSRGCQYFCNFCTAFKVFTRRPRMRSIPSILAEVDQLIKTYKIDEIYFEDDQLLAKQRHTEELLDALASYNLKFDTPNGVSSWLLNERIIKKMRKAGCMKINIALESGVQDVLDNIIDKPVKIDQVPELARIIRREGMELLTFLVVGNISADRIETLDEVRRSFQFCRKIRSRPHVSYLTAYPGSAVLEIAEKKGYLVPGFDWDRLYSIRQQLTTPEWTAEELRLVVEEERFKTHLWLFLTVPSEFWGIIRGYFRSDDPLRSPALGLKKAGIYFVKGLRLLARTIARKFRSSSPVPPLRRQPTPAASAIPLAVVPEASSDAVARR